MNIAQETDGRIYGAYTQLTPAISLNVYLVRGDHYAVWIDSGVSKMFPQLLQTMTQAHVAAEDLRFVLHTHSHHDHMGCDGQLAAQTGCLIGAHPHYAAWHADFEQHYQEFARPFPHLIADTPELRAEVLGILDRPHPLDVFLEDRVQFNLGGGVSLRAYWLPGHMLAEFGWFEASTQTLILGDAVTGLDWPIFHSHLTVPGYRNTLDRIAQLIMDLDVQRVLFAHFPPMTSAGVYPLLDQARSYIDDIESTIRGILGEGPADLARLWHETCWRMERDPDFRALNMVNAHMQDLVERKIVQVLGDESYRLV